MLWYIIHIVDGVLWFTIAASIMYIVFFAIVSLFKRAHPTPTPRERLNQFLVLYPAYNEDAIIINSVKQFLQQNYNTNLYDVIVISDHMTDETNAQLRELPITLLIPSFEKSSKAKALQYAIEYFKEERNSKTYDYVIILDADNVVRPDFLTQLNEICNQGYKAIQCHRCAKNNDNDVAVLDGVSEEINNTIFRKAHNIIGLSSALIGSGMCFYFDWFANNVNALSSAVEDRELETLLAKQRIHVKYVENIHVFDEKVSNADNFQRQRLRWMTGQVQSLLLMTPYIPKAIVSGNINYIDKTVQQALIPRSILIVLTALFCIISTGLTLIVYKFSLFTSDGTGQFFTLHSSLFTLKWWGLFFILCLSLIIAMPGHLRNGAVFGKLIELPRLVWRMLSNIFKINHKSNDFIHTTHNK